MKTSVVLLALATAALAAPALHEEAFDTDVQIPTKFLDAFTRERKSTLESSSSPVPGTPVNQPSSQISEFGVSGRSFNLKKPIIIKKRVGSSYQVYRDSDEEKLDSPEPCRKQVRVNLCDEQNVAKSTEMMRSSTIEDPNIQTTEDDMKHSIMLAKEAVENLQKDMRKIDHKTAKSAPWKHVDSESDVELHQDIEVARQALEHIHSNFGIMETPNKHETLKDAEIVEDVALPLAQTEEERLAQWKDAIENIHRNVELARNIEDSFKSTHDNHDINKHEHSTKQDMRVTENVEKKIQSTHEDLEHSKIEKSSAHNEMNPDLTERDMMESASMVTTSKLQNLNHDDKARLTSESLIKSEHIAKDALENIHDGKHIVDIAEEVKERKTETEHLGKTDKLEKTTGLEKSLLEKQRGADKEDHDTTADMKFKNDKHDTEAKMVEMKPAENTDKLSELIKDEDKMQDGQHTMEQLKESAGAVNEHMKLDTQSLSEMKTHESMVHKDHSFVEGKSGLNENSMMPAMTTDSMAIDQHKPMMGHTFEMKSAEDTKNMHHHMIDNSHMRWAQDKHFNNEMGLMKSAAETHQAMDHTQHMHSGHHHAHQHANPHHLDVSHGHLRQHEQFMAHGKSADMDNAMQPNYYMNMRDSDNMGQEHRFKWRPSHRQESARSSYGAPAPASQPAAGAVGLFPNANVGSCGIPLLLSCNPSVVSGSLAKAHSPSYSAPAYRSEDDFNFHSKRHVTKSEKLVSKPPTKVLTTSSVL